MRRMLMIVVIATLFVGMLPASQTQAQDPTAPIYVRFCPSDSAELIISAMENAETRLQSVDAFLVEFDDGQRIALEGITTFEDALAEWDRLDKLECLAPMNADVQRALSEFLIAMLYFQNNLVPQYETHLQLARNLLVQIRSNRDQAVAYLQNEPIPVASATPEPVLEPGTRRPIEELNTLMETYLLDNGITLLNSAQIEYFPDGAVITIEIDALADFDNYLNVLFTLETLAELIDNWPETNELQRVRMSVVDDTGTEILYVESSGENYRARYIVGTLSQEQFEATLTRIPPAQ